MRKLLAAMAVLLLAAHAAHAQATGTLIVVVVNDEGLVAQADVSAGGVTRPTGADGRVTISLPPGRVDVVVTKEDFDPGAAQIDIVAGAESRVEVELEPSSELEENVVVTATRT